MSNLSAKTEKKALAILAKAVLLFHELNNLNMTATDAFYARQAENILHSIIENNGYRLVQHKGKQSTIILQKA